MVSLAKLAPVLCVILVFTTRFCVAEHSCQWVMDTLEMTSKGKFTLNDNVIYPGGSYFLRIRLFCQKQVKPCLLRTLVYSGYTPNVTLEITKYGLEEIRNTKKILYTEGVLVQFNQTSNASELQGNFLTLDHSVLDAQPHEDCDLEQYDNIPLDLSNKLCRDFRLSTVAWLVPLSVDDDTEIIRCSVTNLDGIEGKIHIVHSRGFTRSHENITSNAKIFDIAHQPFVTNRLAVPTPFWLVLLAGQDGLCLLTHSEFETSSIIKIDNISQGGHSKAVCPESCLSNEVKESLSLPDRVLLTTCFGLQEMKSTEKNYQLEIILPKCITKLIVPPQDFLTTIKVLAIEQSTVYEAQLQEGMPLDFSELKDVENLTVCQFVMLELQGILSCIIQDASINSVPKIHYVFLITLEHLADVSQYIIGYTGKKWTMLFNLPSSLEKAHQDNDDHNEHSEHWTVINSTISGTIPIFLTGLSFTTSTGNSLFIWGNVLLFSPNGGQDIFWLLDFPPNSSSIIVFTSANDGSYAFLTYSRQLYPGSTFSSVWCGQIGTSRVYLLQVAEQWNIGHSMSHTLSSGCEKHNILSLFYDTSGELWKVNQCRNSSSKKIWRAKIPISDLLSHSQLIHEQISPENDIINQFTTEYIPKHCTPFSISYRVPYSNYHSRHVINIVNVPHLVNTIPVSPNFLVQYLVNVRTSAQGLDTVGVNYVTYELPSYMYLKKNDCFSFEVMMSLGDNLLDEFSYWSNLNHLQLSYQLSDCTLLNVQVIRNIFTHNASVKYQFTIKDSGLLKQKNTPGRGLHPVYLRIQQFLKKFTEANGRYAATITQYLKIYQSSNAIITMPWQGDEACFEKNIEKDQLRGAQSMTVLLGCPPGIKILFDPEASVNASKRNQFCDNKHGVACFLYENAFHPVFNILDEPTGNVTLFTGKYQLIIKGGGRDLSSIKDYSQDDIALFNYKDLGSPSTLIWTPKDKDLPSIPAFNISTNGLQWLCGRKSPCAEVSPVFPYSPDFYFKLEFSNRDIKDDTSSCDLTSHFIIRIHGLPLGSLYPATVIVLTCLAIITLYVFIMFLFKRNDHQLWNIALSFLLSKRDVFTNWTRRRINKSSVGPVKEITSIEEYDTQVKKEI